MSNPINKENKIYKNLNRLEKVLFINYIIIHRL